MSRLGRDFERLIERIERSIHPSDAEIKSPDTLKDVQTGEDREVDVSIRLKNLPHPYLTIIECRDRSRGNDVTWVEQLIQKRNSVLADKAIAASPYTFSRAAKSKAKLNNILLLELQNLPANVEQVILVPTMKLFKLNSQIHHVSINIVSDQMETTFPPDFLADANNRISEKIFFMSNGSSWGSMQDVFKSHVPQSAWEGIEEGQLKRVTIQLNFKNPQDRLYVKSNQRLEAIASVVITADLSVTSEEILIEKKQLIDADTGKLIANHAEASFSVEEKGHIISMTKNSAGATGVSVVSDEGS